MRHVAMVMLADRKAVSFAAGHLVGMTVGIVLSVDVPHEVATVLGVDGTIHLTHPISQTLSIRHAPSRSRHPQPT